MVPYYGNHFQPASTEASSFESLQERRPDLLDHTRDHYLLNSSSTLGAQASQHNFADPLSHNEAPHPLPRAILVLYQDANGSLRLDGPDVSRHVQAWLNESISKRRRLDFNEPESTPSHESGSQGIRHGICQSNCGPPQWIRNTRAGDGKQIKALGFSSTKPRYRDVGRIF